ncbi:MarR family winged helix-turn-helix transcriptional regulator [Pseudooceanicola aestuarii]|uniref:MarR family winged helix-turn-helix transcriptional regulator n=1 Tax=Pseudooceanicola aestuarii TaxID=2697319 RepID=UPI0013D1E79A|nr:MarR family winged helix-turn-helix transcriptional regulator [Pseudooceanicola aestuarii]
MTDTPTNTRLTVSRDDLLQDGNDVAFRQMLHNLLAFSARLQQIRGQFAGYIGLSGPQYTLLITVRQLQGEDGIGANAVATHLSHSPAFVTAETNKLVKLDVLNKRPNPTDGRRVLLSVTERGEELLRLLSPQQQEINDQLFEPVNATNFRILQDLARDLNNSAEKALLLSDYLLQQGGDGK